MKIFFGKKNSNDEQFKDVSADLMKSDKYPVMKALTALSIEKVLLGIGTPIFDKVTDELHKQYKCYIPDCYDHPEYLEGVLRNIFGASYGQIVNSIKTELQDYTYDNRILVLIKTMGS